MMSQAPVEALSRAAFRHLGHVSRRTCNIPLFRLSPRLTVSTNTSSRSFSQHTCQLREVINPLDRLSRHRANTEEIAYYKRRMRYAGAGLAFSFIGVVVITYMFPIETTAPLKNDTPSNTPNFPAGTIPEVVHSDVELVETGTTTIPFFPRTITLPAHESTKTAALPSGTGDAEADYTLVGLGVRTVSFLSIQVYVVGIYIATSDLTALQAAFVKEGAELGSASTLIAGEKETLRQRLMDPEASEQIWDRVLQKSGARSVVRIVPTRNTDFAHLRDGFERGIQARVRTRPEMAEDENLGRAVAEFKAMFGRGKLGKGEIMLLERGAQGELKAWLQGKTDRDWTSMGEAQDERVSRLLWLGYLGGKKVASESCRQSVVDGVMTIVERPIGTAETQVI